ncbi:MAG: Ig-like domain-containing protein [Eubacteriales bacterium]
MKQTVLPHCFPRLHRAIAAALVAATLCVSLPLTVFAQQTGQTETTAATVPTAQTSIGSPTVSYPIEFPLEGEFASDFSVGLYPAEMLTAFNLPMDMTLDGLSESGFVARVRSAEPDLNSVVLADSEGNLTLFYYENPVKYYDEWGFLNDKSLSLVTLSDGGFRTRASDILTTFSPSFADGIELSGFDVTLRLTPDDADADAILSDDEKTVVYETDADTRYEYTLTAMGFKEDIIVESYTGQTEYSFLLETDGLTLTDDFGTYVLVDEYNTVKATLGDIILFTADERNNAFGSMSVETVTENESYLLTIELDEAWLSDPDTLYPITIDPTITLNTTGNIEDVSIVSTTTYSGTSGSLYIGRGSSGAPLRVLMRFPNLNISGYSVTGATVSIRDIMCEDDAAQVVECHEYVGNSWSESGTTTWSGVGSSPVGDLLSSLSVRYGQGNVSGEQHRYAFDITALAQKWANGTASPSKGVIFKATDSYESGGTNTYRTFASINRGSNPPILTVNYSSTTASISLNKSSASLYINDTLQLSATTTPGGSVVTWSSGDPAIASVSASGLVTAHTVGSATITATANGVSASCTVTVRKGNIVINKPTDSVLVGGTIQLTATTTPGGRTVTWTSSDTGIATVSASGLVTFSLAGTVTVTASATGLNPQSVTLYGIVQDGVYNLKNAGSLLYVRMEGNNLFQTLGSMSQNGVDHPLTDVRMMWRIHYIGSGRYTVRSYANPALAIGANGGVACVSNHIPANDGLNVNYGITQWYISQDHPSYYILTNALTEKILSVPAGNETTGTLLTLSDEAGTISDSNRRWMLEPLSSVPTGIFLYRYHDEGSQDYTTAFTKTSMTLEVGEYRRIKAIYRDPDNISQSFTWSVSNTGVATHDGVDKITTIGSGNATVTVRHSSGSVQSFTINVTPGTVDVTIVSAYEILTDNSWFGHAFLVLKNNSKQEIYIGNYLLKSGCSMTVGKFNTTGIDENRHEGIWYNMDSYAYCHDDKYTQNVAYTTVVPVSAIGQLSNFILSYSEDYSLLTDNCVTFATRSWNQICRDNELLDSSIITPGGLKDELTDKFSGSSLFVQNYVVPAITPCCYWDGTKLISISWEV